jgi:iron complex outermembrane receptor protein
MDKTQIIDVEFNHVPATSSRHKLIWGLGWRRAHSEAARTALVLFSPAARDMSWTNAFVQDEIAFGERLHVTAGVKLESNSFSGLEVLPTLRASYSLGESGTVWGGLSRAVRAPSRIDREFFFPASPPFAIKGNPEFQSEVANVAELGYRAQPGPALGYSVTAFHHQYGRLRGGTGAPSLIENRVSGIVEGVEAWANWSVAPRWRVSAGLVELRKSLQGLPGTSANAVADLGNDPRHQWMLRSSVDLPRGIELDFTLRHAGSLPAPAVAAYTSTDVRLAWQATRALNLSLLVQNLLDPNHIEYNAAAAASQIPRRAFLMLEWRTP